MKYFILILSAIALESAVIYLLYLFVNSSKLIFTVFSLVLLFSSLFALFYGRYREKIKIKPKKEVLSSYSKAVLIVLGVIAGIAFVLIAFRAIQYLIIY